MAFSDYFSRGRDASGLVREPAVAGRFYPAAAGTLRLAVRTLLARARPATAHVPIALVAPHAGYVYSGQVAADAFAQARSAQPDVVVVLGAAHTRPGADAITAFPGIGFRTPLGIAPVRQDLARGLAERCTDVRLGDAAHADEHSVEVVIPFLQVLFPGAPVLPIVVGVDEVATCERVGRALAALLAGTRPLVVASSDLSHYPGAADAARADRATLEAIASFDAGGQAARAREVADLGLPHLVTAACGLAAVQVATTAARALGATRGRVISYANSSEVAIGEPQRVVGYGAVAFDGDGGVPDVTVLDEDLDPDEGGPIDEEGGRALVALARATVTQYLESETLPLPRDVPRRVQGAVRGAFVTLRRKGELRGCIGHLEGDAPLPQLVSRVAYDAAFHDPRFAPMTAHEVDGLAVEVSVLTPPRLVSSSEDIVVGRDGVILRKSGRTGVFLPKVAIEQGWDRDTLLEHLCAKAGLPRGAWKDGAELRTFEAQVFSD